MTFSYQKQISLNLSSVLLLKNAQATFGILQLTLTVLKEYLFYSSIVSVDYAQGTFGCRLWYSSCLESNG